MTTSSALASPPRRLTQVARASLLLSVFFALDKALGLLRQILIGRQFGISAELDAFNAANNIPDLLFALISGGALTVALIPVLSETLQLSGRPALWQLFSRVANWAFVITAVLAVVVACLANSLVRAELGIAPGFHPAMQDLVVQLMRLNLIATLIFSISGLVMAGLQANQHFLLPAMAPALYNLGLIFGALILAPSHGARLGPVTLPSADLGIQGLVYGVILGAALHLLVQIPGLFRYRFRWTPRLGVVDPGLRKVARLMGPRILTIGAFNLVFVIQDNLASRLPVGSVTALVYGWLIMQLPQTLIGTAIGMALLPTLSEHFARKQEAEFSGSLARAARTIFALSFPAALLLALTIEPFIQALFAFEPSDTALVAWAARAYLAGLVGHCLLEIGSRGFYARQNARLPLAASLLSGTVFVLAALLLFRPMGAAGIALSNSLAYTLEAALLLGLLARRYPAILRQGRGFLRILIGGAVAAAVAAGIMLLQPASPLLTSLAALAAGGLVALVFIRPEIRTLAQL
jgi:putative peptidoglycan lipid II flippase